MKVSLGFGDFYVILEARCHPLLFRDGFLDSCVATSLRLSDAGVAFHLHHDRKGRVGREEGERAERGESEVGEREERWRGRSGWEVGGTKGEAQEGR